jgi:hypothetical protein
MTQVIVTSTRDTQNQHNKIEKNISKQWCMLIVNDMKNKEVTCITS